ncbi:MAG: hypothetical protein RL632_1025, partial [Bacteroidota bacterium]
PPTHSERQGGFFVSCTPTLKRIKEQYDTGVDDHIALTLQLTLKYMKGL